MLIFPAIDMYGGKAVRLYRGDYEQMTVYSDDPVSVARDFVLAGAEQIHMVDLEGARDGDMSNLGTVREIFKNPLHPYTHGLLGSVARINDDRKRFVQIPSSLPSPMHKPSGCYFHPRCVHATERCKQEMPPLEQLEGGRCVRCWNYKEIRYDKQ